MPLINHVRGEQVPDAMLNVRTPIVRIPLWATLIWWTLRGLGRVVAFYVRHWYATAPVTLLLWLWVEYGWTGPVLAVVSPAVLVLVWWLAHRPTCEGWVWLPVLSRWRLLRYRRVWHAAMVTARLTETFDRHTVLPVLRRVRCTPTADVLTVRMVTGQIPDDFAAAAERLAHTFGVRQVKAAPGAKYELVRLVCYRTDALSAVVAPMPVPSVPDFTALPVAVREDGATFALRLFGTQVLIVGSTGSGKGSVIWSIVRAVAAGVGTGLVELWGLDPKGGMELGIGRPVFARFASRDFTAMAELLEEAAGVTQDRAHRLMGTTRQHQPTVAEPLILIFIDELANLTAYLADRQLKDRIKAALGIVLTQGRAVGVHVVAAIQDPRKEVLPARGLFPTRITLRLAEESEVEMVLGKGMRERGALCDRIPLTQPGVGYVVLEGDPTPMRVRFSYLTDDDIRTMAATYGRLRVIDGEVAA
ncbi:MAG TPA: cell division protein FtsK [Pilimelia sp.]|nr:cell division protein FtsK [Pilimelia sp.]